MRGLGTFKHLRRHGNRLVKVEPLYNAKLITKSRLCSVSRALLNAVLAAVYYESRIE